MQRKTPSTVRVSALPPASVKVTAAEPVAVRVQLRQLRLEVDVDQRMLLDPLDQVGGHATC